MTPYEILSDGATAAATIATEPSDDRLPVHGVIIGDGDVTEGLSGKRTRWPGDVLEAIAEDGLFEGKPITMADSLAPEQHVGVVVEGDGEDRTIQLTGAVSMDEKVGEVTRTAYEDGVGLLFEGFLADWDAEDVVDRGLAQVSPVLVRDVELVEGEEGDDDALFEPVDVGAARDLALVADGAAPSNEIGEGRSPELDPSTAEALAAAFDTDADPGGDDGPRGGSGQSTSATSGLPTMDDLTDQEKELVAAARQKDDPTVVEAEVPDRLSELEAQIEEHEELIEEAGSLEEPAVMDAGEAEAMSERVDAVEEMMAEALQERTGLSDASIEAMPFEAMASEFETDEGDLDVEALTQSPETGSGPSTGDGGADGPTEEDLERIEEISSKISTVGSALPRERVEALREEAADLADVDDYDAALEVL